MAQMAGSFRHLRRPGLYELQRVRVPERRPIARRPFRGQSAGDESRPDDIPRRVCFRE